MNGNELVQECNKQTEFNKNSIKNKNMNVKFPEDVYDELKRIADELGGMTLSAMVRVLIYSKLEEVQKSGDPRTFIGFK